MHALTLIATLAALAADPAPAAAPVHPPPPHPVHPATLNVPGINGHMTDPTHKLSDDAKKEVEDRLTKIAEDTHIDLAGWITNAPDDQVVALGNEAYKRWSIGVWWDNGVFFAFPAAGQVHIIQDPAKPELTPEEVTKLLAADKPSSDYQKRIDDLEVATRAMVEPKTQNRARPWGTNRPQRANVFLAAAAAIALAAIALSFRRRKPTAIPIPIAPATLPTTPDPPATPTERPAPTAAP
jgi:hypothetical protein